jgi:hypothetical protein
MNLIRVGESVAISHMSSSAPSDHFAGLHAERGAPSARAGSLENRSTGWVNSQQSGHFDGLRYIYRPSPKSPG